ncbi:hypothetical protein Tco_0661289, partial [Tanacetum coccineum]
ASLFNDKWHLQTTLQASFLKEKKGLVQNSVSLTTYVPPSKRDYEILFQPLFDEYFNPPPCAVSLNPIAVAAPRPVDPAGSPLSTTIDQDVPSASTSPTNQEIQFQVTHQDPSSEEPTLQRFIPSNLHNLNQSFDTPTKLTKNQPLENVIGDPSRPVLIRSQLHEHAIWCYFNANDNPIPFGDKMVWLRSTISKEESWCQNRRDLPRDNPLVSVEVLRYDIKRSKSENKGIVPTEMELVLEQTQQGTSHEVSDYIEMEMQIPHSSIVKFIATCSYSRLNDFKTSRKNDPKLPQTLISTSSSICQSDEVMN